MIAAARLNGKTSLTEILNYVIRELTTTKALSQDFVVNRIKTFLPDIFSDIIINSL
jgi:hypothetical protein